MNRAVPRSYKDADEKLSPVVRQIVPQAEQIFRDQYVMEFIGGKEYEIRCRWSADGILYSMAAEKGDGVGTDSDVQQGQDAARP